MLDDSDVGHAALKGAPEVVTALAAAGITASARDIRRLLLRVMHNYFGMPSENHGLQDLGRALSLPASYINHACASSLIYGVAVTPGQPVELRFHAARAVAAGDPVTTTYVKTLARVGEAQARLQESHHFVCACEYCKPPHCPRPLLSAFICPSCAGPLVPASLYHPAVSTDGSGVWLFV